MADFENESRDATFIVNASYGDTVVKLAYADGYMGAATLYHPETGYIETVTLGEGTEITVPACTGLILVREDGNSRDDTPYVPAETEAPDETEGIPADTPASESGEATEAPVKGGCRSVISAWCGMMTAAACAVALRSRRNFGFFHACVEN
jgi:hypothetical protein